MVMKEERICIAVLLVTISSESIALNFCKGQRITKPIILEYKNTSKYMYCRCHVKHAYPDESKNYTVKSRVVKSFSDPGGGYYNLSFISGGRTESNVDKTIPKHTKLFSQRQNIATDILLDLRDSVRRPALLKIVLSSGRKMRVSCGPIPMPNITETTTSLTESPTSTQGTNSTHVTTSNPSSVQAETSSVSQTPTSTVSSQVLPSTAEKGSDSIIPVAGGVVGGLLCIAVGVVVSIFILRRRRCNGQQKHGAVSKSSHDNPMYGTSGPDVIYDVAKHVTDESRDFDHHDVVDAPSDPNYFILEGHDGNTTGGSQDMDESGNNKQREEEDCYNHADIASGSENRSKGDNYVNVPARARQDYDHIKPNAGFSSGQLLHPSDKDEDTYDHTGHVPLPNMDSDNCYNHLGQFSSESGTNLEDCYNHVGDIPSSTMTKSEDCYNHLGQ